MLSKDVVERAVKALEKIGGGLEEIAKQAKRRNGISRKNNRAVMLCLLRASASQFGDWFGEVLGEIPKERQTNIILRALGQKVPGEERADNETSSTGSGATPQ